MNKASTASSPQEVFSAARLMVRRKLPYFRAILLGFAPVETPECPTMGVTEHGVLLINWDFIRTLTPDECAFVLVHEVLHVTLKHVGRRLKSGKDPELGNWADDLAINPTIVDMGFTPPTSVPPLMPEQFGFPRGLTSDEYYELLRQREAKQKQGRAGQGSGQGQGKGGAGGQGQPQDPNDQSGQGGQGGDDEHQLPGGGPKGVGRGHCGSCAGNPTKNEPGAEHPGARSAGDMERLRRHVAEAIKDEASKSRGTVPGMLQRWAAEVLSPPEIPWQTELGILARAAMAWRDGAVQHRYDAPSRRQAGIGYGPGKPVLPRLRMPVPKVAVIADTSGSMSPNDLMEAARETNGILKAVGADVTLCTCDAEVTGVTKVRTVQEMCQRLKGGGGTDMRPAFTALTKERPQPDLVVCITDGQVGSGFPATCPRGMKVIIVLVGAGAERIPYAEGWAKTVLTDSAKKSMRASGRAA